MVVTDAEFWYSMWNTLYYVIGTVPLSIALSLGIAILLNQKINFREPYRVIYFIPVITSINAISIVWRYIYQTDGVLNRMIGLVGIDGPDCRLDHASRCRRSCSCRSGRASATTWSSSSPVQNVPPSLTTPPHRRGGTAGSSSTVTWPMISPTTFFVLIMSTMSSFQAPPHFMMTGGGPLKSTTVVIYHLSEKAYGQHKMGEACALAFVLSRSSSPSPGSEEFVGERCTTHERDEPAARAASRA
jgi:multiple sugar transport system permease protein